MVIDAHEVAQGEHETVETELAEKRMYGGELQFVNCLTFFANASCSGCAHAIAKRFAMEIASPTLSAIPGVRGTQVWSERTRMKMGRR